jgi:hypothetical protein
LAPLTEPGDYGGPLVITLKEFVQTTLEQIADGVAAFNATREGDVSATPRLAPINNSSEGPAGVMITSAEWGELGGVQQWHYATPVDFDVAVTANETEGSKVGGGLRVVQIFNAEAGTTSESSNTSVSRVKFRIPLQLR